MNSSIEEIIATTKVVARLNTSHTKLIGIILRLFGQTHFFNTHIIYMQSVGKSSITHKFFLKLFNKSFFLGDTVIFDISNVPYFVKSLGSPMLTMPYQTFSLLVDLKVIDEPITVSNIIAISSAILCGLG